MTAWTLLAATLAGTVVGTPRGEALRLARGRHWYGRLVVTSPYTLCDGQRLHLWASGRPPLTLADVRIDTKTPGSRYSHSSIRVGGSNGAVLGPSSVVPLAAPSDASLTRRCSQQPRTLHGCAQRRVTGGGVRPASPPTQPAGVRSSVRDATQRATTSHST